MQRYRMHGSHPLYAAGLRKHLSYLQNWLFILFNYIMIGDPIQAVIFVFKVIIESCSDDARLVTDLLDGDLFE